MPREVGMVVLLAVLAFADPLKGCPEGPTRVVALGYSFTESWAVVGPEHTVIIDTRWPHSSRKLMRELEHAGVDPTSVSLVVATHGHKDHFGSAPEFQAMGIPIAVGGADAPQAREGKNPHVYPTDFRGTLLRMTINPHFQSFEPDILVTDSLDLRPYGVEGEAIVMGGHTDGSIVVKIDGGRVFVGDLIRSHLWRRHEPSLHFFEDDLVDTKSALRAATEGASCVLPGHGGALMPEDVNDWLDRHP